MGSPDLPPDPYAALGVAKDATAGAIKTQYRKLVLKFHPDKVQDEDQKKLAADEFHKIQTAYEIVGDEDKRARYDAQCKLAELRRDVMERHGSGRERNTTDVRSPTHKTPTDVPRSASFQSKPTDRHERTSPTYEERRPSYATRDYFEPPRPSSRKTPEYERSSKRAAPRDDRERTKTSAKEAKKSERASREERNKKATKEMRRDRDRKPMYVDDDSSSSPDEYERQTRRMREEEAREAYNEQVRRQREDASQGLYDGDPRAKKLFTQEDDARMYMSRSSRRPDSERRPSPVRKASSREKVAAYARGKDGRPTIIRRESTRPRTSGRESDSRRPGEARRPSVDVRSPAAEMMEEIRPERRPPTLNQSKSSPIDARPLFSEKQRSQSLQMDRDDFVPQMRRSETMPNSPSASREREARRNRETAAPPKSSNLRQTEFQEGIATPGATPEYAGPNPANRYQYGHKYADDAEYPTPDGYRTEIREPASATTRHAKYNRSPSPERERERDRDRERGERERERERGRGASEREKMRGPAARYAAESAAPRPSVPGRTTSTTSYVVTPTGVEPAAMSPRPGLSRENSSRASDTLLYGEVPIIRQPKNGYRRSPPPAAEGQRYQVRPEDLKAQSGGYTGYNYARRPSEPRPSYTRQATNPVYVR